MEATLHSGDKIEYERLMAHIEQCPTCKQQYDELQREQKLWEQALYSDEIPSTFTTEVMQRIHSLEIEDMATSVQDIELSYPKSGLKKMRSSLFKMKVVSAALAVIVMVLAISIFVQPSLAERIRSMFTLSDSEDFDVVDPGLRSAFKQGYVTPADYVAQNGDYTLEVKEVYSDPLRVSMSVLLRDKDGNEVKDHSLNLVSVEVTDNQRHIIANRFYGLDLEGSEALPFYVIVFKEPVITDDIRIKMVLDDSYTKANSKKGENKYIPGQWEIYYVADIRKAKESTLLTPLTEHYTTPSGMNINMNGVAYAPSGLGLSFTTSMTKEAQQRSPGELEKMNAIYYHYEKNGEPWDGYSDSYGESDIQYDPWNKETRWYTFDSRLTIANKKDDIKFVLDGYSTTEQSDERLTFKPAEISESNPAVFDSLGDSFKVTGVEYFENHRNYGDKNTIMSISDGVFTNTLSDDEWEVIDEDGRTYRTYFSFSGMISDARFGKQSYSKTGEIIVESLTHVPEQLTLRRKIVGRLYKDVNWSFILPKEGTVPESNVINRDY